MKVIFTGSSGLIGSKAVKYYDREGHKVFGVDNNMRAEFFGSQGDTSWNLSRLRDISKNFEHDSIDIREHQSIFDLFEVNPYDSTPVRQCLLGVQK